MSAAFEEVERMHAEDNTPGVKQNKSHGSGAAASERVIGRDRPALPSALGSPGL